MDVRFEGTDAGLAAQAVTLRKLAAPATETATSDAVWQAREELWSSAEPAAIAKFSVLPASVAETCGRIRHLADSLGVQWRAVVQGTGLGWLRLEASSAPCHPPGATYPAARARTRGRLASRVASTRGDAGD